MRTLRILILNIDYPFGDEAYYALKHLLKLFGNNVKGIYFLGKAAGLTGHVGDVAAPRNVYDEVSDLYFAINNTLKQRRSTDVAAVHGTVLNNRSTLEHYKKQNIGIIEMESGPFLKAIYDYTTPNPVHSSTKIKLRTPCKLGLIYYFSDTPLKGATLGAGPLATKGITGTYSCAIAIANAIFE